MSLENNSKILMGSILQSISKRKVLGDTLDTSPIALLSTFIDSYIYAMYQYNAGNKNYQKKIEYLNKQIYNLKTYCPEICIYRDRLIVLRDNTPPIIEDNIIEIPLSGSVYTNLPYNEVIHNYQDAENNLISQIVVVSTHPDLNLIIDSNPVITGNIYYPPKVFDAHYNLPPNTTVLVRNMDNECNPNILFVNTTNYNNALSTGEFVEIDTNNNLIFQQITNTSSNVPNDTIVYFHIDTSSMAATDQVAVRDKILEWWVDFKIANPGFGGSMLINTVPNSTIDPGGYAPGRGSNGVLTIANSELHRGTVEAWLENPTEALLRQAYKEGLSSFPNEDSFLQYAEGKNVIVLTFVDETSQEYHGGPVAYPGTLVGATQPSAKYVTDYNKFIYKVRPRLNLFKGLNYPITRNITVCNSYILHAISSIEGTDLTPLQIDTLIGSAKITAFYTPVQMNNFFYTPLSDNVYKPYPLLKASGWEGKYSKYSPVLDTINSSEFTDELDDLLNSGTTINVTTKTTSILPGLNKGPYIDTPFQVKVRDNHPFNPLFSNTANIIVRHVVECENTPICSTKNLLLNHKQNHVFTFDEFSTDPTVDSIVIEDMPPFFGVFKLYDLVITDSQLPLRVSRAAVDGGHLTYTSSITQQGVTNDTFTFELRFEDAINNSLCDNIFTITKQANPNPVPEIFAEDMVVTAIDTMATVTVNAILTYSGLETYKIYWEYLRPYPINDSWADRVYMTNETTLNMTAYKLAVGDNYFRVTVKTDTDGLIGSHIVKVTVNP